MSKSAVLPTRPVRAVLFGIAGAIVVGLIVLAFVWPSATSKARDIPVGISGPAAQVKTVKDKVSDQDPKPVHFVTVSSRADAVDRIKHREIYGAILLGTKTEVLTSSAASTATNQMLRGIGQNIQTQMSAQVQKALVAKLAQLGQAQAAQKAKLQQAIAAIQAGQKPDLSALQGAQQAGQQGAQQAGQQGGQQEMPSVKITDVVPLNSHDSTSAGLAAAAFPLVMGGMIGGIVISIFVVGALRRFIALTAFGAAAGLVLTLIMDNWFQFVEGNWGAHLPRIRAFPARDRGARLGL